MTSFTLLRFHDRALFLIAVIDTLVIIFIFIVIVIVIVVVNGGGLHSLYLTIRLTMELTFEK
jgi:hypothetical protein